jgi:hypothetical protein
MGSWIPEAAQLGPGRRMKLRCTVCERDTSQGAQSYFYKIRGCVGLSYKLTGHQWPGEMGLRVSRSIHVIVPDAVTPGMLLTRSYTRD